jgi:hypothetical protein
MIQTADNSGGAAAMRGFYVQTLAALFKALDAEPPFITITLEPVGAQDQFDFSWRDAQHSFAVQVKSTRNEFSKTEAEKWAIALKAASSDEQCTLILVGNCNASLNKVKELADVRIEKRSLDICDLDDAAAQRLALFMEANQLHAGTAIWRAMMVGSLVSKLFKQAISRQPLIRSAFIELLRGTTLECIRLLPPTDIDRITRYAPEHLLGREAETALLSNAWQQVCDNTAARPHILSFVALGGEGKTSLVADWVARQEQDGWPGCEAAFAWSFYSQGTEQQAAASSDLFIHAALQFFGETALAGSSKSGVDKARRLAQVVGERRALLILDGVEPLQYPPTGSMHGALKDQALAQLLRGLAGHSLGLCVLTTRYAIPDLNKHCWRDSVKEHKLLRLTNAAGVALLGKLKVHGAPAECAKLVESVQGHALSIHLFGSYLRDAHGGDIRRRDRVHLADANAHEQGGHAFRVMDAYAQWLAGDGVDGQRALALLRLLGLFDRPASFDCIAALLQAPVIDGLTGEVCNLPEAQQNLIQTRLQDAGLLTLQKEAGVVIAIDAHPLLREYFAQRLSTDQRDAWQAAHRRLYTYLCENTKDEEEPTSDDLQPLYQAVAHGCLAGMQQQACVDVYRDRILRGDEFYSTKKLGSFGTDLGAVACFFEQPWQRVSPALSESDQAWLLNQAAFRLRALGRLTEAAEPMRASLVMDVVQERWEGAAISANNLAELELALGDLAGAMRDAGQAVTHADRSDNAFLRMGLRTTHADALHQVGQPDAAMALFCEAEAMQVERQPAYPLLYALQGFRYCDLLLAAPQACAWRCSVQNCLDPVSVDALGQAQTCQLVAQRAVQTLAWAEQNNIDLLDIALNHLTLGRAALFAAILAGQPLAPCQASLKLAVDGLRRAGYMYYLPRGLLTRAWLSATTCHHTGPDSAESDLDEAWDIAEAGPMPLFMADIHLHRAGLFHHITPYPWQSPAVDAQAARRLIEKHGYLRRMADLEVVEQAIGIR